MKQIAIILFVVIAVVAAGISRANDEIVRSPSPKRVADTETKPKTADNATHKANIPDAAPKAVSAHRSRQARNKQAKPSNAVRREQRPGIAEKTVISLPSNRVDGTKPKPVNAVNAQKRPSTAPKAARALPSRQSTNKQVKLVNAVKTETRPDVAPKAVSASPSRQAAGRKGKALNGARPSPDFNALGKIANVVRGSETPDATAKILRYDLSVNSDSYEYSYETSNGIRARESGQLREIGEESAIVSDGEYSYTGPDNKIYKVSYVADENGFQPTGSHLPTPPPVPEDRAHRRSVDRKSNPASSGTVVQATKPRRSSQRHSG